MDDRLYCVYILSNKSNTVLYVGVTNDLSRRTYEHKQSIVKGFTSKYQVNKLVYYEAGKDVGEIIQREKQIKSGSRAKKNELINAFNPKWEDMYEMIL